MITKFTYCVPSPSSFTEMPVPGANVLHFNVTFWNGVPRGENANAPGRF
jgi:hypothetical protein